MSDKVRLAIIGTGGVANGHILGHKRNADIVDVVALADIVPDRAAEFAARYGLEGCRIYGGYEQVMALDDIDAVDICLQWQLHGLHGPASLAALAAGKHVLSEKPFASSVEEAEQMARMAQASGLVNLVDFTYRHYAMARFVRQLIDAGELGEIIRVRTAYLMLRDRPPRYEPDLTCPSANILGNLCSHSIDLARFFGGEIVSVKGQHGLAPAESEIASAIVEFANGAIGSMEASSLQAGLPAHLRTAEVYGSKGAAFLHYSRPDVVELAMGGDVSRHVPGVFTRVPVPGLAFHQFDIGTGTDHAGWIQGLTQVSRSFAQAIQSGGEAKADFEDGYRNQVIMHAIAQSSASGETVDVTPD